MSSPFFEATFTLPQPPEDELVDGLPVVQLPEDADLLSSLISLLYPIPPVIPGSYQKVFALLAACQKYEMVSIQQDIRDKVRHGRFPAPIKTEAFSAYAHREQHEARSRKGARSSSNTGSTFDIRIPWRRVAIVQGAGTVRPDL
jgi:hypothetical protein